MKSGLLLWCVPLGIGALLLTIGPNRALPYPRPAGESGFTADKGRFRILQQGNEAGIEEFDLAPAGNAWVMHDETVIRVPGSAEVRTTGQLRLSADGVPLHYDWSTQGDKKASGAVEFDNGTAKTSASVAAAKEPIHQDFKFGSSRVAVLDNNLYEQYAVLGRIYDWNGKGNQKISVLIPQDATPGSVDVESLGPKTVDGVNLQALRVHSTDLEIQIYLDAKFHLVRVEVPAAKVVIVRQ
jgi:hypothetical protein